VLIISLVKKRRLAKSVTVADAAATYNFRLICCGRLCS
jgi:hypothetical protein